MTRSFKPIRRKADTRIMTRMNYVFVDFENVQEEDWERIAGKPVKVLLILGVQQKNLPAQLVRKLLKVANQVQLVETKQAGKNALDIVLAQYVGAVRVEDPAGYFHIVSKDTGFDALVSHLRDGGTLARRHARFSHIPVLMSAEERVSVVIEDLKKNPETRPKKRPALESKIQARFGRSLSESDMAETICGLVRNQTVTLLDSGDVKYAA